MLARIEKKKKKNCCVVNKFSFKTICHTSFGIFRLSIEKGMAMTSFVFIVPKCLKL